MAGKKRYRSRSVYGRRTKKAKTMASAGPVSLGPKKAMAVLDRARYAKSICVYSDVGRKLNPGIASCVAVVFSLNGMYDPDISGIGQQPTGFDQYMALYGRYTVLKAKVTASCYNEDTTNAVLVGCNVSGLPTTFSDPNIYMRNNNMDFKILEKYGTGSSTFKTSFEVDLSKFATNNLWSDLSYSGTVSSNPTDQWYLQIWAAPADGTSDVGNTTWDLRIEYLCAFREPVDTTNS